MKDPWVVVDMGHRTGLVMHRGEDYFNHGRFS